MKKHTLNKETKLKALACAAEILAMHGQVAGNRVCQDWSGSEEFNPDELFTETERQVMMHNYEIMNSGLEDYDPEFCSLGDEMVVSFVLSEALSDMLTEMRDSD